MPKLKNKCNKVRREPNRLEDAPAEEIAAVMIEIVQESKSEHDSANKIRLLIDDLIRKTGQKHTRGMNKKQRDEAMQLFLDQSPALIKIQEKIGDAIRMMKDARVTCIKRERDNGGLDALHVLQLRHGCLPVWYPWISDEPYGVAGIQWSDSMKIEKGTEVAAFVDTQKTWIMAEVKGAVSNHRYECIDIDDEERKTAVYARKQIIPMPKYTVDYRYYPHFALPKNAIVLALFPKSTCFYEGIVYAPPERMSENYLIRFVDTNMPGNYAAPVEVSDRYVVAFKKDPVIYVRPSKRVDSATAPSDEPSTSTPSEEQAKPKKKKNKKKKASDEIVLVEEKDVPGPAPKPLNTFVDPSDVTTSKSKTIVKPRTKSAEPKVKIIRAKIPPHKKAGYNRLFGKKRRKPKKTAPPASDQSASAINDKPQDQTETDKNEEMEHDGNRDDDDADVHEVLTGLAMYGLEDEREETESEESSDDDSSDDENESNDKNKDEENEGAATEKSNVVETENQEEKDNEEKPNEEDEKEEEEEVEEKEEDDDNDDDDVQNVAQDEQERPHDSEEGTSSQPAFSGYQSDNENGRRSRSTSSSSCSSSSSSSAESGLSLSDHERNRKAPNSDHEPEL